MLTNDMLSSPTAVGAINFASGLNLKPATQPTPEFFKPVKSKKATSFFDPIVTETIKGLPQATVDVAKGIGTSLKKQFTDPSPEQKNLESLLGQPKNPIEKYVALPIFKTVSRFLSPMFQPFAGDVADIVEVSRKGGIADMVSQGKLPPETLNEFAVLQKTAPQIVGDIAQAVIATGAGGLFTSAARSTAGTGALAALKYGGGEGLKVGTAFGVGQALSSGSKDPLELASIVGTNTAIGGVLGAVTSGAIPVSKATLEKVVEAKALYDSMTPAERQAGFAKNPLASEEKGKKQPLAKEAELPVGEVKRDFTKQTEKIFKNPEQQAGFTTLIDTLGLGTRRVTSMKEIQAAAQELGTTPEVLLKASDRPSAGVENQALKNLISGNGRFVRESEAKIANNPSLEESLRPKIDAAKAQTDAAVHKLLPEVSRAGLALRALREDANNTLDPIFWLHRAQKMMGSRKITPEIEGTLLDLVDKQDRGGLSQYVSMLRSSTWAEKAASLWKAGLLTAFRTHEANILGNTTMATLETTSAGVGVPLDAFLSIFPKTKLTGQRTITISTATIAAKVKGLIKDGPKEAFQFLKSGVYPPELLKKYDVPNRTNFETPFLDGYVNGVFRVLASEDVVFRRAAISESLATEAEVIAKNEGLKGIEYKARVRELLLEPTAEMQSHAVNAAEYNTFQTESKLAGKVSSYKQENLASNKIGEQTAGLVGEVVAPFVGTPTAIGKTIIDYTPIGFIKAVVHAIIPESRSQRTFVKEMSRAVTGTGVIFLGSYLASKGLMTGAAPSDTAERAQFYAEGKLPYATLVDGSWRRMSRVSPVGNLLGIGASFDTFAKETQGVELYSQTGWAGVKTLADMTMLQGISGVVGVINDPDRNAMKYLQQMSGSLVPALVAHTAHAIDPKMRIPTGVIESVENRLPGLTGQVPVRRDIFGNTVTFAGGRNILDPFESSKAINNPIINEAKSIGVAIGLPDQTISGTKMTDAEFSVYQILQGKTLEANLQALINSEGYKALSIPEKEKEFKNVITLVRQSVNDTVFPALMVKRYNLSSDINPQLLRAVLAALNKEPKFVKLPVEKQGIVIKNLMTPKTQ